jgi:hypothetical protein
MRHGIIMEGCGPFIAPETAIAANNAIITRPSSTKHTHKLGHNDPKASHHKERKLDQQSFVAVPIHVTSSLSEPAAAYPWPEADEYLDHVVVVRLSLANEDLIILMPIQIVAKDTKVRNRCEI